jgi:hypothetical protein
MNYAIKDEIRGFNDAMEFFNHPVRLHFSKGMVLNMAKTMQKKYSQTGKSNYAQGFYDAAVIIVRTRE